MQLNKFGDKPVSITTVNARNPSIISQSSLQHSSLFLRTHKIYPLGKNFKYIILVNRRYYVYSRSFFPIKNFLKNRTSCIMTLETEKQWFVPSAKAPVSVFPCLGSVTHPRRVDLSQDTLWQQVSTAAPFWQLHSIPLWGRGMSDFTSRWLTGTSFSVFCYYE